MLDDSAGTVRESIKALRSLLVEIYPPDLEAEGLPSALSDLLARTSSRGLTAELDTAGLAAAVPGPVAALLYRVAQEGVRNALTHARATSLVVRLASGGGVASVSVEDNGIGFDPTFAGAPVEEGEVGLKGLRGLVEDAGGSLSIDSAAGTGTRLHAEVPLR